MTELLQDFDIYTRFALALALGLIIGIERGWHQRQSEEGERIAGIRTFGLISLLGAFWGLFADIIGNVILGFALIGFVGLIIAGYILSVREHEDYGMTTEIAAFITFSLGVAVVKGYVVLSIATGVIMVLILSLKPR
ncbi:MAG: MgtC/SapB family protein, partial [Balneolaceae bacterium]|nr:MgtC/SapB family protein [Balneolaceae bacterium]